MLQITSVTLRRWSKNAPFDCEIVCDFSNGEVKLKIDEARVQKIVEVIADLIVEGAQETALELKKQALDYKSLPAPQS